MGVGRGKGGGSGVRRLGCLVGGLGARQPKRAGSGSQGGVRGPETGLLVGGLAKRAGYARPRAD